MQQWHCMQTLLVTPTAVTVMTLRVTHPWVGEDSATYTQVTEPRCLRIPLLQITTKLLPMKLNMYIYIYTYKKNTKS